MHSVEAQWLPVSTPLGMPPKPSNTIATQTVGLFYPSTRGIEKEKEKEAEKMAFEKQMRDRRPLLTAVSPGKGDFRYDFSFFGTLKRSLWGEMLLVDYVK